MELRVSVHLLPAIIINTTDFRLSYSKLILEFVASFN